MQHVRVRHHEVRVSPDQGSLGPRGVAIVDGRLELRELQRSDLPELVAGERLGGKQVERGPLRVRDDLGGERQVVHQGLAARGSGGHDEVPTCPDRVQSDALVVIQALDAEERQPIHQQLGEVVGEGHRRIRTRGEVADVRERLVAGDGGEERAGVHARDGSRPAVSGDASRARFDRERPRRGGRMNKRTLVAVAIPLLCCWRSAPRQRRTRELRVRREAVRIRGDTGDQFERHGVPQGHGQLDGDLDLLHAQLLGVHVDGHVLAHPLRAAVRGWRGRRVPVRRR